MAEIKLPASIQFVVKRIPPALGEPVLIWGIVWLTTIGWYALLHRVGLLSVSGMYVWDHADTGFYLQILEYGYISPVTSLFYPLYPLLGRVLRQLSGFSGLAVLLWISAVSTLICFWLLYRLAEAWDGPAAARRVLLAAAFFPGGFFLWAAYPQSLVLALILAAWWSAGRGRWVASALFGLAAGLTHSTALLAVFPLLILAWKAIRARKGWLRWLLILPAGFPALGMLLFWVWRIHAGFDSFHQTEYILFQRVIQFPWQTLAQAVREAFDPARIQMMPRINLAVLVLLAGASIWSLRRLPAEYSAFLLAGLCLGLTASSRIEALWSFIRFATLLFPLNFAIAAWTRKPRLRLIISAGLLLGWLLLSAVFYSGAWVA